MPATRLVRDVPCGAQIFQRMFTRLGIPGRPPRFEVAWFPYASLTHTIRLREDTAYVRVSDLLRRAPQEVFAAAALLLLARLYRLRAPRDMQQIYRGFVEHAATRRKLLRVRGARGRRVSSGPRGAVHDLENLFARLNRRYFSGTLPQPHLAWSKQAWRRQLGSFDPGVRQIVLNRRLDRATVPGYAVEYVLYHEMLHVKHPLKRAACGLQAHSPEFRRAEKRFAAYQQARKILERLT
jgi:hypothetical protein